METKGTVDRHRKYINEMLGGIKSERAMMIIYYFVQKLWVKS